MSLARTLRRWTGYATLEDRITDSIERSNLVASVTDERDYRYIPLAGEIPKESDLRAFTGSVEDQLSIGSCVGNGIVSGCELLLQRAGAFRNLSRLFPYYNSRELEGRIGQEGTSTRNGLKVSRSLGICNETTWPYIISKDDAKPSTAAYAEALTQKLDRYECIYHPDDGPAALRRNEIITGIRSALAEGCPVAFAFFVGSKFRSLTGPLWEQRYEPVGPDNSYIGNHLLLLVGARWGILPEGVICENSWGDDWGDQGYGRIPWSVITQNIIEAWALRGFAGVKVRPPSGVLLREIKRDYLAVRIAPSAPGPQNIYVAVTKDGAWLVKNFDTWQPYTGGDIPAHRTNVWIDDERDIEVVKPGDGVDLATLYGADVYVAHGFPLPTNGGMVCTVPRLT